MIRNWKMLGFPTILAAALVAAPPAPAADEDSPASGKEKNAAQVQQALRNDVRDLTKAVNELKTQIEGIQENTDVGFRNVKNDMDAMKRQIADLRRELDQLKKRADTTTISGYGGANGGGTARVRMINTYPEQITVVINDKYIYNVEPGERKFSDPIPAGTFTYQVLRVTPVRTRTVAADGTFTFEVHPQGG
ncbi:MAG TPA: hypothetical protein VG013_01595 [Gemmataceae bacterium]|nr:hypothetical protein [Gemmataceae bacterium]